MEYRKGQLIDDNFLLLTASVEDTRRGKKYVKFNLRDRFGTEIEQCKKWDCEKIPKWTVIRIIGKVDEFNKQIHIVAKEWEHGACSVEEFAPKAPWELNGELLLNKFRECFGLIKDEALREWIQKFIFHWEENGFPKGEAEADILNATAAIKIHHAYQHGWLEHVYEVIQISSRFREIYEKIGILSEKEGDLLIAGAFIHDVGKLFQFKCTDGIYEFSDLCKAYGWHSNAEQIIGSNMLVQYCTMEGYPLDKLEIFYALNNMIISHHGNQYSIGNSTYIISRILHFADNASADVNRMSGNLSNKDEVERDKIRESYMRIK